MKKIVALLAVILICIVAQVSIALAETLDLVDEWYVIPLSNEDVEIWNDAGKGYVVDGESISITEENDCYVLTKGSVSVVCQERHKGFGFVIYVCNDARYLGTQILLMQYYGSTKEGIGQWKVQTAEAERTFFSPTHMYMDGDVLEYYNVDNRLFIVQGNDYSKWYVDQWDYNVFVLENASGKKMLFVRSE